MKRLLLALALLLPCHAAQLDGAVRLNSGTSGTNTTSAAVTITTRTNLNAGKVRATNSVVVGVTGQTGVVQLTGTNGTYTLTLSIAADGSLAISNNTVLVGSIAAVSGYDGTTNKFLNAAGTYTQGGGVNPTTLFAPYNTNGVFADSPINMGGAGQVQLDTQLFINNQSSIYMVRLRPDLGAGIGNVPFFFDTVDNHTTNHVLTVQNAGVLAFGVSTNGIVTAVPASATNALALKVGQVATGTALTLIATNYLQISINGVAYKVGLVE